MTPDKVCAHNAELVAALKVEHARIKRKRDASDQMLEALKSVVRIAAEAHAAWDADKDVRVGKMLFALSGRCPGYRADIDKIHAAIRTADGGEL